MEFRDNAVLRQAPNYYGVIAAKVARLSSIRHTPRRRSRTVATFSRGRDLAYT